MDPGQRVAGWTVHLAGAIAIEHGGRRSTERDLPGAQPRLALTVLVLERARPVTHYELAEVLWPSGPPATWQPALRRIVAKVRRVFDAVGVDGPSVVVGEAGQARHRLALPAAGGAGQHGRVSQNCAQRALHS